MYSKYMNPMLVADFYKFSHRPQYPKRTTLVSSPMTPRASRMKGVDHIRYVGGQMLVKIIHEFFHDNFFSRPKEEVVHSYHRFMKHTIGDLETKHVEELHDLGYLPIEIKDLPEGLSVPLRVPVLTIRNTMGKFYWVTNFLETFMSCEFWKIPTSATIAHEFKTLFQKYAKETSSTEDFALFQGHDFSFRGMGSVDSAVKSSIGHLSTGFLGTDTAPGICAAEYFYDANIEDEVGS